MGRQMLLARDPQLLSLALLPLPDKKLGLHAPLSKFCLKFIKEIKTLILSIQLQLHRLVRLYFSVKCGITASLKLLQISISHSYIIDTISTASNCLKFTKLKIVDFASK